MREQERANAAAQKFFRQPAQFAARIVQKFGNSAFLARQKNSIRLYRHHQRRPRRERNAQLLLRRRQNFHEPRMISLVQARRAQQDSKLPQEKNYGRLGV